MKKILNLRNLKVKSILLLCLILKLVSAQSPANFDQQTILKKFSAEKYITEGYEFIVIKTDNKPKPVILFVTGSGFNPFFINGGFAAFPFDVRKYKETYNFAILTKPGVPLNDDSLHNKFLNNYYRDGVFIDSTGKIPNKFIVNNNCNYYEKGYLSIIQFLKKQTWVDKNAITLIGHSQGAYIATSVANKCSDLKNLILLSPGSPYGRFNESIRKIRFDETFGLFSSEIAQNKIDSICNRFKDLEMNKSNNTKLFDSNTYYSYYSFTYPLLKDKIIQLKTKTLIIYGTASNQDLDCDYLPLELTKANKNNIEVHSKIGYDHNFFKNEFNEKNEFINKSFQWNTVINETINWINKN